MALALTFVLPATGSAQGFVFTKIVDNNDPIPGYPGRLFRPLDRPALDGDTVVFRNTLIDNTLDSIWTAHVGAATPIRIADQSTAVPGGVGNFSQFDSPFIGSFALVRGGNVVFIGRDSNPAGGFNLGLYSAPATGGAISRVVDYNTAVPGGTGNFNSGLAKFSLDQGRVAFAGSGPGNGGVFAANLDGSVLASVADGLNPSHPEFSFPVVNFGFPAISAGTVAFIGNTVFDPFSGYNALYTASASGGFSYNEIATSNQPLPGDSTASFHTRFGAPRNDGSTIAFYADDANSSPNYFGLFTIGVSGGAMQKVVSRADSLPGLLNLNGSIINYSLRDDRLAFIATDDSSSIGLYAANFTGGTIGKIVATGDPGPFADTDSFIGGQTNNTLNIGDDATSGGRIVFHAGSGIYLATPFAQSADLQVGLTAAPTDAGVGATVTYNITHTNAGPAAATAAGGRFTLPAGLTFLSSSTGSFNPADTTLVYSLSNLAAGQSAVVEVIARVDAPGSLTASAFAESPVADSNRTNNHAMVTVPAPTPGPVGPYRFTKIVDNQTAVPDRLARTFLIPGSNPPALDANKIVFFASDTQAVGAIWSANADGSGGLLRLADSETPVPNTSQNFSFFLYPRLRNDTVVFVGYGANSDRNGIYSVPVGGGTLRAVVDQTTLRPEGTGAFFSYQNLNQIYFGSLADGQIAFTGQGGIYRFPVAGSAGRVLAYPGTTIPVLGSRTNDFGVPAASGGFTVFEGSGGGGALQGFFQDDRRFVTLADTSTPAPGSATTFSVNGGFSNAQVEGETVVFTARSGPSASTYGIYRVATAGGAVVKLVDTNTPAPGGSGNFASFRTAPSFSFVAEGPTLSAGEVVFAGTDADGREGLYSVPAVGGAITKIIAVGDSLGGGLVLLAGPSPIQPNSLGQHRLVFRAQFMDTATNLTSAGIFVAGVPPPPTIRFTSITKVTGGFLLQGLGVPSGVHRIQATGDLLLPFDPTPIGTATADPSGNFQFTDSTSLPRRFYRAVYP